VPWLETESWSVTYSTLGEAQKVNYSVDRIISGGGGSLAKFGSSTTAFKIASDTAAEPDRTGVRHWRLGAGIYINTKYMTINVKPLGDRVLVQPLDEKEGNKGGIIIPDTAKEKPQEGTVAAVGTGKLDDDGKKIEFTVKVGDKVLIPKYGGTEIKIDGENYLVMREDDILGIIG
jgi:chaperonin GroES